MSPENREAMVRKLAVLLAEYEGYEAPGLPTGKARWLLDRLLAGAPLPESQP